MSMDFIRFLIAYNSLQPRWIHPLWPYGSAWAAGLPIAVVAPIQVVARLKSLRPFRALRLVHLNRFYWCLFVISSKSQDIFASNPLTEEIFFNFNSVGRHFCGSDWVFFSVRKISRVFQQNIVHKKSSAVDSSEALSVKYPACIMNECCSEQHLRI